MPEEKTPKSARVVALNDDGSPRIGGITPLGQCGKSSPMTFRAGNGVRLTDIFDMLHAGIRDIRERMNTADLPADDFFETFETLVTMHECLIALGARIETRRR